MKIHIIRHGDPDYSIDSLTKKGWREAELLSERIIKMPIDDFYCSPLGRAKDTASLSLKKCKKEAQILEWLREFDGRILSPFTGEERISWDIPPYMWGKDNRCYTLDEWEKPDFIVQSNISDAYKKVTSGVDALLLKYGLESDGMIYKGSSDKTVALFCHFALGITVLSYLVGISPIVAQHNFFLAPTSVTTLVTETDSRGYSHFRASEIGDTSHLYAGNEPVSESGLYPNFEV